MLYESLTVREAVMKLQFYQRIMRIQLIITIIHIPVVLFLVICRKLELRSFPWDFWGAGNVRWISVTSMGVHFCMGRVDCRQVILDKDDKLIELQGRKGRARDARIYQAVRLLVRYDNCMNITTSRATLLYSAPSASRCNYKEEERYITLRPWLKRGSMTIWALPNCF